MVRRVALLAGLLEVLRELRALVASLRRLNDIFSTKRLSVSALQRMTDAIESATRGVQPGRSRLAPDSAFEPRWGHYEWNTTHAPLLFERLPGATVRLTGRCSCGAAFEGPPETVHGGHVALMFDDVLGALVGAQKKTEAGADAFYVTASLNLNYRKPTPLHTDLLLTAWVERQQGRKMWVKATMSAAGVTTADADGLFIAMRQEARARL